MSGSQNTRTSGRCPDCGSGMLIDRNVDYASYCPECGRTCVFASGLERHNAEAKAEREAEAGGRMAVAGVPALFRDVEPDFEVANRIRKSGRGLYLQGGNGTSKTLKAASIAKAFLESRQSVKFVSSAMLMSEFKDTFGTPKTEADVFAELNGADLLVIDDLGKENPTSWAATMLFTVIDGRYGSGKPIVVTSNFSKRELSARLSANLDESTARAIVSRLSEMTEKVDMGGEDRRLA